MTREEVLVHINAVAYRKEGTRKGEFSPAFIKYVRNRPELSSFFDVQEGSTLVEKIYLLVNHMRQPKCSHCGKPLSFYSLSKGYYTYCSDQKCKFQNNPEIWEKMKKTYADKHNGATFGAAEITQQKRKQTSLEKYGVEHFSQDPKKREIASKKKLHTEYLKIIENCKQGEMTPLFLEEEYLGVHTSYKFQCAKCGKIKESNLIYDKATLYKNVPRCFHCNPSFTGTSQWEKDFEEFIKPLQVEYSTHNRKLIPPYEVDFVFPQFNFAVELNGNYYHSELGGEKTPKYHQQKMLLAKEQGYKLCQIFQDEWEQHPQLLQAYILSNLGIWKHHIGARQCEFKKIMSTESRLFLDKNHFQGFVGAAAHFGLFFNKELLAVMTFGIPRFTKKYDMELLRFAVKSNWKIPGAFSKLYKNAQEQLKWNSIVTYADARFFTGGIYPSVGFKYISLSNPNYFYLHSNDYMVRESRIKFQKHRLANLLPSFDISLSEWENMKANGYDRIWDCGNFVYSITN